MSVIRGPDLVCSRAGAFAASTRSLPILTERSKTVGPVLKSEPIVSPSIWDENVCVELAELYVTYVHDQSHSFHKPSFMQDLRHGKTPKAIVYAMMALSARFWANPAFAKTLPTHRAEPYARESQALLNLKIFETSQYQLSKPVSFSALIANCLDLPLSSPSPIMRDVHFRVYWTLCMIDVWPSDDMNLHRQMARRKDVPLPIDEEAFLNLSPRSPSTVDMVTNPDRNDSLLAQMIKLNSILLDANDDIRDISTTQPSPVSKDRVAGLSLKLDNWLAALPNYMHDTRENLQAFATKGLGRIFVA